MAGVHWRSDTEAGRLIAGSVYPLLKGCPIFQTVLASARAEPGGSGTLAPPPECAAGASLPPRRRASRPKAG